MFKSVVTSLGLAAALTLSIPAFLNPWHRLPKRRPIRCGCRRQHGWLIVSGRVEPIGG